MCREREALGEGRVDGEQQRRGQDARAELTAADALPVEHHRQWPILRLPAASLDVESAITIAPAGAGEAERRRVKFEVGEVQDTIRAALPPLDDPTIVAIFDAANTADIETGQSQDRDSGIEDGSDSNR